MQALQCRDSTAVESPRWISCTSCSLTNIWARHSRGSAISRSSSPGRRSAPPRLSSWSPNTTPGAGAPDEESAAPRLEDGELAVQALHVAVRLRHVESRQRDRAGALLGRALLRFGGPHVGHGEIECDMATGDMSPQGAVDLARDAVFGHALAQRCTRTHQMCVGLGARFGLLGPLHGHRRKETVPIDAAFRLLRAELGDAAVEAEGVERGERLSGATVSPARTAMPTTIPGSTARTGQIRDGASDPLPSTVTVIVTREATTSAPNESAARSPMRTPTACRARGALACPLVDVGQSELAARRGGTGRGHHGLRGISGARR